MIIGQLFFILCIAMQCKNVNENSFDNDKKSNTMKEKLYSQKITPGPYKSVTQKKDEKFKMHDQKKTPGPYKSATQKKNEKYKMHDQKKTPGSFESVNQKKEEKYKMHDKKFMFGPFKLVPQKKDEKFKMKDKKEKKDESKKDSKKFAKLYTNPFKNSTSVQENSLSSRKSSAVEPRRVENEYDGPQVTPVPNQSLKGGYASEFSFYVYVDGSLSDEALEEKLRDTISAFHQLMDEVAAEAMEINQELREHREDYTESSQSVVRLSSTNVN